MTLSKTDEEVREGRLAYVDKRWSQLSELELAWSGDAVKYLLFVNSGAAAAVLAFLGTSVKIQPYLWPKVMLGSFVLGVVFLGFYQAVRYHRIASIYKGWREDVDHYYNDKLDWEDLTENDHKRAYSPSINIQILLAYLSFACFLVGVAVGICNFTDLK